MNKMKKLMKSLMSFKDEGPTIIKNKLGIGENLSTADASIISIFWQESSVDENIFITT